MTFSSCVNFLNINSNLLLFYFLIRVQISNADLVLKNGDTEQALTILRQITPEQRSVWCGIKCFYSIKYSSSFMIAV